MRSTKWKLRKSTLLKKGIKQLTVNNSLIR